MFLHCKYCLRRSTNAEETLGSKTKGTFDGLSAHHHPHVYALRKPAAIASSSEQNQRLALVRR